MSESDSRSGEAGRQARSAVLAPHLLRATTGPQSEATRSTADAIMQRHVDRGRRGLALCGATSGVGVSFVAASLAIDLADSGVRVLLVDANLRRPALHDLIIPSPPPELGLLQFLTGETDDPAATVRPLTRNLSVVYAGGVGSGIPELFDSDRFALFMRYTLRGFTLTLLDAPPANRCAETRRIAGAAGYAAIVGRLNVSRAEDLGALAADMKLSRVDVIGTILNEG